MDVAQARFEALRDKEIVWSSDENDVNGGRGGPSRGEANGGASTSSVAELDGERSSLESPPLAEPSFGLRRLAEATRQLGVDGQRMVFEGLFRRAGHFTRVSRREGSHVDWSQLVADAMAETLPRVQRNAENRRVAREAALEAVGTSGAKRASTTSESAGASAGDSAATPSPSKHRTKRDDKPVSERESAQIIAGDQQHIRTLFEGEFFGEISLLEEKASSASVRAAEYTSLMVLLVDQFQYGTRPGPGASHAHPHSPPPAPPSTGTSARGSRS